ncbi:MAG TPA: helix-hairpin-helix domain-containing protein [Thermoflexales bacterium]|nr:helix-hairpin-helix domain-containing protein [Thermoflexales bacterium]
MIQFGANDPFVAGTWPVIFGIGLGGLLATLLWYFLTKWFYDRNKHTSETSAVVTREWEGKLSARDTEIANLKAQLSGANTDWEGKLKLAQADLDKVKKASAVELAALTAGAAASAAAIKGKDEQLAKLTADLGAKVKAEGDHTLRFANLEKDWTGKVSAVTSERDAALKRIADLDAKLKLAGDDRLKLEGDLNAKIGSLNLQLENDKKAAAAAAAAAGATALATLKSKDDELGKLKAHLAGIPSDWEARLKAALDGKLAAEADLDKAKKAAAAELAVLTTGAATAAASIKGKDDLIAELNAKIGKLSGDLDAKVKAEGDHTLRFASAEKDWTGKLNLVTNERDAAAKQIADLNARIGSLNIEIDNGKKAAAAAAAAATAAGATAVVNLKGKDDEIARLKAELDAKAKAVGDHTLRFASAEKDWTGKLNLVTNERDAAAKQIADLNARIGSLNVEIDNGKKAAAAAAAAATAAGATAAVSLKGKDDEIARLKAELDAKAKAVGDHTLRFASAEKDWTGKLNLVTNERDAAAKQIADLNARIGSLNVEIDNGKKAAAAAAAAATAAGATAAVSLKGKDDEIARLKAELDAKAKAEGDHTLRFASAEKDWTGKLNLASGEIDGLKAQIGKLSADLNVRNGELNAANAKLGEIPNLRAQIDAGKDLSVKLDAANRELSDLRAKSNAELAALTAGAAASAAALKSKEDEINGLKAQTGKLSGDLNACNTGMGNLQARLAALEGEYDSHKKAAGVELAALTTGAATSAAALKSKEDEIAALKAQMADLEAKAAAVPPAPGVVDQKRVAARKQALVASATVEIKSAACPQHLSDTKGVGQVYEQKLYAEGIGTFFELANTPDEELRRIFDIKEFQDVDLGAMKADAIRLANETNSVGRVWDSSQPDDLAEVEGIGWTYEKRLYDAGICTFAALVKSTPEELERICGKNRIKPANFVSWIEQAQALMAAKK